MDIIIYRMERRMRVFRFLTNKHTRYRFLGRSNCIREDIVLNYLRQMGVYMKD